MLCPFKTHALSTAVNCKYIDNRYCKDYITSMYKSDAECQKIINSYTKGYNDGKEFATKLQNYTIEDLIKTDHVELVGMLLGAQGITCILQNKIDKLQKQLDKLGVIYEM